MYVFVQCAKFKAFSVVRKLGKTHVHLTLMRANAACHSGRTCLYRILPALYSMQETIGCTQGVFSGDNPPK